MEEHDLGPAYAYHRRVLQHLQWRHPAERWVLKAPAHIFGIEPIFATYPDAGIIHLHRDPLEVAASLTSLTVAIYAAFSEGIDPRAVGRDLVESLHSGLRPLRPRARPRRGPAAALSRPALPASSRAIRSATVRRIYEFFAIPLSAEAEARMRRFLAENPQAKHGDAPLLARPVRHRPRGRGAPLPAATANASACERRLCRATAARGTQAVTLGGRVLAGAEDGERDGEHQDSLRDRDGDRDAGSLSKPRSRRMRSVIPYITQVGKKSWPEDAQTRPGRG